MNSCNSCPDRAIPVVVSGALTSAGGGTVVPVPAIVGEADPYNTVTLINDTDQDIKFIARTKSAKAVSFIVPKSIKAFTKKFRESIVSSSVKVESTHASTAATGNITLNFSN